MERVYLWKAEEYTYPLAFEFRPHIRTYLHPTRQSDPPYWCARAAHTTPSARLRHR